MIKASEECIDKCSNLLGWKKIAEVEIILSSSSFHVVPCNFIEFPNILKGWKYNSSSIQFCEGGNKPQGLSTLF